MESVEISVMLNPALLEKIQTYCDLYSLNENELLNEAVNEFMQHHQEKMTEMIEGYLEMARINSEIAKEFSACESEAYAHIR